jgi:hypothetical protein
MRGWQPRNDAFGQLEFRLWPDELPRFYLSSWNQPAKKDPAMPPELDEDALAILIARAGLSPTVEQMAGLKAAYLHIAAMAANVRRPRGRMAEPVLTYGFTEEDLA